MAIKIISGNEAKDFAKEKGIRIINVFAT